MSSSGRGEEDRIAGFESATAGEVFRNDGVVALLAKFVGIAWEGGEKGQRIVDAKDFESTGGEFGGGSIEEEANFTVGADGTNSGGSEGEGFGLGIEGFESAGDQVGGGSDEEIGFNAFPYPLVDRSTKAVNHDGDTDGHGNGDREGSGGEAVSVKTAGKGGAGKDREGEGQRGNEGEKSSEGGSEKSGGEKNAKGSKKSGSGNSGIKGGGREEEGEDKAEK
jgi:hypothetical protein